MRYCLSILALFTLVACSSSKNSTNEPAGSTACGSATCSAGEYCAQSQTSTCSPGCTSNENCATSSTCVTTGVDPVGVCSQVGTADGGGQTSNVDAAGTSTDAASGGTTPDSGSGGATANCAGFIAECLFCSGDAGGASNCTEQFCQTFSAACVNCVAAATSCTASAQQLLTSCGCI